MDGAKNIYTSMLKIDPNSNATKLVGSWLLAKEGKKDEALKMSENIGVYSILNMKKEAIQKLDVEPQPYQWIKNDKLLDFIRDEPEFQAILLRERKIYEERLAKYGHMFE